MSYLKLDTVSEAEPMSFLQKLLSGVLKRLPCYDVTRIFHVDFSHPSRVTSGQVLGYGE